MLIVFNFSFELPPRKMSRIIPVYKVADQKGHVAYLQQYLGLKTIGEKKSNNDVFLGYHDLHSSLISIVQAKETEKPLNLGAGYGHIAILSPDIYNQCAQIKADGGKVTREPGPVLGGKTEIAFIEAPEGFKYELIKHDDKSYTCPILHLMLRVGNLDRSKIFYQELGMSFLRSSNNEKYKYTLEFVGFGPETQNTVIEFTYNWGVESYQLGNSYSHLIIIHNDIHGLVRHLIEKQICFSFHAEEPNNVYIRIVDPDGYALQIYSPEHFSEFVKH